MRVRLALAVTVAAGGAWLHGCGSHGAGGGGADAGAADAAVGEDGASDGGGGDALSDDAAADVSSGDDAVADATTAETEGSADAAVGTLVITADATVKSHGPSGPCAALDSLAAVPNRTTVGHAILLTASGIDPQGQRSDVTLTWTAVGSAGSLAGAAGPSTSFNCTAAGTEQVTVTTSISGGGASCPGIGALTVTLSCDSP